MNPKLPQLTFLKMTILGHPLFENPTSFSVVNDGRVLQGNADSLHHLFSSVWVTKLITLAGKNATGKTTVMKALIGTLTFLLANKSIEQTQLRDVLIGNRPITIVTYFYGSDSVVYQDRITLQPAANPKDWHVASEQIFEKPVTNHTTKKQLFDFSRVKEPLIDRQDLDPLTAAVLAPDDSVFRTVIAQKHYQTQPIIDTLMLTNVNTLIYGQPSVPPEILQYLDPTIDYLKIEPVPHQGGGQLFYRLKFRDWPEEITETNFATIEHYLSSGTAKGITLYGAVLTALKTGGIIFVDELENHFNHAIVQSFIEYFADPTVNQKDATLIFSTHYSELLSDLDRNDEIYLTKREKKIELQRYSQAAVRKDLNRTEVFDSNYLGGTSPKYRAYMDLKKATKRLLIAPGKN